MSVVGALITNRPSSLVYACVCVCLRLGPQPSRLLPLNILHLTHLPDLTPTSFDSSAFVFPFFFLSNLCFFLFFRCSCISVVVLRCNIRLHCGPSFSTKSHTHHFYLPSAAAKMQLKRAARVLLVGAPGVGKGTQTTRLHDRFPQLQSLSTGDLLRHNVKARTPIGMSAHARCTRQMRDLHHLRT